jgi:Ca-activated chloride channel family protein
MIRLAQPALLTLGMLFLVPFLLRPQRVWHYSGCRLLPSRHRAGFAVWCLAGLTGMAISLLLIALARPQQVTALPQHATVARDIVLTLDLSLSMEGYIPKAGESIPTMRKLALVQQAAQDFVKRHLTDRLGLIVFGDEAFGAWPLSTDSTTLQRRLENLEDLLPAQLRGTHVEKALVKSLDHLHELGQAQTRIVVLLTDGLDNIPAARMEHILQRLQRDNVTLYVFGVLLKEDSSIAVLARRARGRYFAIDKAEEMAAALEEIERLEPSKILLSQGSKAVELYAWFTVPGLALLLASVAGKSLWMIKV